MTKIYCDSCKKEINLNNCYELKIEVFNKNGLAIDKHIVDLCDYCYKKYFNTVKGKENEQRKS